ncbi:MAG TPA: ECF-type sigma factor [Vicinamibacteria bacterium]|nr:ECF-type sigma factor [Vicinamibacteria bacterium]
MSQPDDLTGLLRAWARGEPAAQEPFAEAVYGELHRQAARQLRRERRRHTLQPTALVNEAYLRLLGQSRTHWKNRAQFFGVAARMMRRVLVDHARRRNAARRAGGAQRVTLDESLAAQDPRDVDVLALDEAFDELTAFDPERARLVELRYFGGLSLDEAAQAMNVSEATVTRQWRAARAWLFKRLSG